MLTWLAVGLAFALLSWLIWSHTRLELRVGDLDLELAETRQQLNGTTQCLARDVDYHRARLRQIERRMDDAPLPWRIYDPNAHRAN